ncbi:hypothetical protein BXU01_10660 [[Flexibacter] sp. ATCC 35103]|nr:hypothetical protein BXU01_10660 [[Flexibacter] sp. ATCC 35103]
MIFFDFRRFVHQMLICRPQDYICDFTKLKNHIRFLMKNTQYIVLKLLITENSFSYVIGDKGTKTLSFFNQLISKNW